MDAATAATAATKTECSVFSHFRHYCRSYAQSMHIIGMLQRNPCNGTIDPKWTKRCSDQEWAANVTNGHSYLSPLKWWNKTGECLSKVKWWKMASRAPVLSKSARLCCQPIFLQLALSLSLSLWYLFHYYCRYSNANRKLHPKVCNSVPILCSFAYNVYGLRCKICAVCAFASTGPGYNNISEKKGNCVNSCSQCTSSAHAHTS